MQLISIPQLLEVTIVFIMIASFTSGSNMYISSHVLGFEERYTSVPRSRFPFLFYTHAHANLQTPSARHAVKRVRSARNGRAPSRTVSRPGNEASTLPARRAVHLLQWYNDSQFIGGAVFLFVAQIAPAVHTVEVFMNINTRDSNWTTRRTIIWTYPDKVTATQTQKMASLATWDSSNFL